MKREACSRASRAVFAGSRARPPLVRFRSAFATAFHTTAPVRSDVQRVDPDAIKTPGDDASPTRARKGNAGKEARATNGA